MNIHILSIPGMGTQGPGFSKELQKGVKKYAKGTPIEGKVNFYETTPFSEIGSDVIQGEMFNRINHHPENKLDFTRMRKFAISALGDAVTFERGASGSASVYRRIHDVLKDKIQEIHALMSSEDKLVIVASSLGVHLISTYIYDADESKGIFERQAADSKNNLSNLNYMATIGCNLPLFLSGIPESKIKPINKDGRASGFKWHNYYDRDDILGWPLAQLSSSYGSLVQDFEIDTGITPLSHIKYWGDRNFTKPFTNTLIGL